LRRRRGGRGQQSQHRAQDIHPRAHRSTSDAHVRPWLHGYVACRSAAHALSPQRPGPAISKLPMTRHVGVADFIVNNNPQTMDRSPRSFPTAAGWLFFPRRRVASLGQNAHLSPLCPLPAEGTITVTAFASIFSSHDVKQPISFPRRIFAPRVCNFASLTPNRGVGGAPRNVRMLGEAPVGRIMTRYARRLARRLASHDAGRSPLGAPPWRFWAPGSRFSPRHLRRIGYSELLAPRS
jgi:hypothetical protein